MIDVATPAAFDWLLVATTIPLLAVVTVLTWTRILRYRKHSNAERRAHEPALLLSGVIASFAWMAVSVAFLIRPLADLFPDVMTGAERVTAPLARFISFVVALVLLLQETRDHPDPPDV